MFKGKPKYQKITLYCFWKFKQAKLIGKEVASALEAF